MKEKGQFTITQLLKQKVVSDKGVAHFCQIVCGVAGALVLVFGFRRLSALELTEVQLFAACVQTLFLAYVFIIVGFQCRAWRRAA